MAKKFQFRLDFVRDMRKRTRDEAARQVAQKVMEVAEAQRHVDEYSRQLRDMMETGRSDREKTKLEIAALKIQQCHGKWLHDRMMESGTALGRAEADLATQREKLVAATAKLKAIEKLRERRLQKHLLLVRREEQAITDEVAGRMGMTGRSVHGSVRS